MASINAYEIELRFSNSNTREVKTVTCIEYAYSVADAVQQAVINHRALAGSAAIAVVRVSPPEDLIRAATHKLADDIAEVVRRFSRVGVNAQGVK